MRSRELSVPQTAGSKAYSNQPIVADNDSFSYVNFPLFFTTLAHSADDNIMVFWLVYSFWLVYGCQKGKRHQDPSILRSSYVCIQYD